MYKKLVDGTLKVADTAENLTDNIILYIKYKNVKDVCKNTINILEELNLPIEKLAYYQDYEFNRILLTAHGLIDVSLSGNECTARINYNSIINLMVILVLTLLSILFVIVLYNAFLITVNERKKEYAVLNSIGGTERTNIKTNIYRSDINRKYRYCFWWNVISDNSQNNFS